MRRAAIALWFWVAWGACADETRHFGTDATSATGGAAGEPAAANSGGMGGIAGVSQTGGQGGHADTVPDTATGGAPCVPIAEPGGLAQSERCGPDGACLTRCQLSDGIALACGTWADGTRCVLDCGDCP